MNYRNLLFLGIILSATVEIVSCGNNNYIHPIKRNQEKNKAPEEFLKLKARADRNENPKNLFKVGYIYYFGNKVADVEIDLGEATKYFKMAADKGNTDAMIGCAKLGEWYPNEEFTLKYLKMATDKNHLGAMYCYAVMLKNGWGVETNIEEAEKYFKIIADKKLTDVMEEYRKALFICDRNREVEKKLFCSNRFF